MVEVKEARAESSKRESINHHHQRVYEHNGSFYMLDKTMDGMPPFYTFYALGHDPRIESSVPQMIPVDNQNYWGDGLTWGEAENKISQIVLTDGN